jgi:signal peptidase I
LAAAEEFMTDEVASVTDPASSARGSKIGQEVKEWARTLVGAFLVYLAVTTVAFANYSIPSESMTPTLEVGDRVVVSKIAYGYSRQSLPLGLGNLLPPSEHRFLERMPARGDVIVFMHPQEDKVMIKRLIGLPGDVIQVINGRLSINGQAVDTSQGQPLVRRAYEHGLESAVRYEETLPNGIRHPIHLFPQGNEFDNFGPYTVPAGHFFFMGDNRDNSLDSRYSGMGVVPMDNLIGKAETVYYAGRTCDHNVGVTCPQPRWLRPLHD